MAKVEAKEKEAMTRLRRAAAAAAPGLVISKEGAKHMERRQKARAMLDRYVGGGGWCLRHNCCSRHLLNTA